MKYSLVVFLNHDHKHDRLYRRMQAPSFSTTTVNTPFSFQAPVGGQAAPLCASLSLVAAPPLIAPGSCLSVVQSLWLKTLA